MTKDSKASVDMVQAEEHELVAAYALNALDEDERRTFEAHLGSCPRCRGELAELGDAAASLAFATADAAPPPALRDRILDSARAGGAVVPLRHRYGARVAVAAAAVAACAAVGLGLWAASLSESLSRERDALRAREAAVAVLADPAARRVALTGRSGVLAVDSRGRAALAVRGLPPAPRGRTYEAWVIERAPRPAGTFDSGGRVTVFALRSVVPEGAKVAVTIERAGGVDRPTTKPLLVAQAGSSA